MGEKKILQLFDCAGSLFEVYKKKPNLLKDLSARDNNLFRRPVSPFKHEIPQNGSHLSRSPQTVGLFFIKAEILF